MTRREVLVAALALAGLCSLASAQAFHEDFESYASGSALHGQGGWKGWDDAPGTGAPISSKYARSGSNSVEVVGTADLVHEFELAGGRWEVSALQYIPAGSAGNTYFILLNRYRDGGDGYNDWSVQLSFDLDTGIVTAEAEGGDAAAPIIYDRWVELRFLIDLAGNTCAWYYAGELIASHAWDDNAHGTLQAIDLFGNNASGVYYDDIQVVPHVLYAAYNPSPADGATGVVEPVLRWTKGDTSRYHNVYLGAGPDLTEADLVAARQQTTTYHHTRGFEPGVTYSWRIDEIASDGAVYPGDVWHFTTMPALAFDPAPADGSDNVFPAPVLSWRAPPDAVRHHVYFSEDSAAVTAGEAAADRGIVDDATFCPGLIRAGTTYYLRVDVIGDTGATRTGDVWSFTTAQPVTGAIVREWWTDLPGAVVRDLQDDPRYPSVPTGRELVDLFEGPTDWKDNYGSRLYGWLKPPAPGPYTFWVAGDDSCELRLSMDADPAGAVTIATVPEPTALRDFDNADNVAGATQRSQPIVLQSGRKYYLEALLKEGSGSDHVAVAWQPAGKARVVISGEYVDTFGLRPLKAAAPSPRNGAVDTAQSQTLRWFAGERAVRHDVYFGDDAASLAAADPSGNLYRGRQTGNTWDAGDLEWGKTYFWRVDEIADDDPESPWKGALWSFTTADFILVDDFESYTDDVDANEAIYQTWTDGVTNGTGSFVGYEFAASGTFGETTVVHRGGQSLPLDYNNVDPPYCSETERTWPTPQDWTTHGVDRLVLYMRGRSTNDPGALYVALADREGNLAVVPHRDPTSVTATDWLAWEIPLSRFTGVDPARIERMSIGVGDRAGAAPGGRGTIYIDDIRVVKP